MYACCFREPPLPLLISYLPGEIVDLYIPRKCSASNRIIAAKDHSSVQINLGEVDESGRYTGSSKVYAISGEIRRMVGKKTGSHELWAVEERE